MSWEIDSVDEIKCPCGKGKIIRENRSDDWNRFDERVYLACSDCNNKIHIESKTYGYGIDASTVYYLVKNGETIQEVCADYSSFESNIAGLFYLSEIECALMNMRQVKFSTHLSDRTAKMIVKIHKKRENSVRLATIIPKVKSIIKGYNEFKWNRDKIENEQRRRSDIERIQISFINEKSL